MYVCVHVWLFQNHHYPFKDQQAYSVINVCVFVNTTQEMDME